MLNNYILSSFYLGSCKTTEITIPQGSNAPIMLAPTLNNQNCIWLVTAPNYTRIRLSRIGFLTGGSEFLTIGDGHNASDDDSMITKIEGDSQSLSMVTSRNLIWMKYFGDVKKPGNANMTIIFNLHAETGNLSMPFCLLIYSFVYFCGGHFLRIMCLLSNIDI